MVWRREGRESEARREEIKPMPFAVVQYRRKE